MIRLPLRIRICICAMTKSTIVAFLSPSFPPMIKLIARAASSMLLVPLMAVCCFAQGISQGISQRIAQSVAQNEAAEYFERHVRPLLIEHCAECHSGGESSGGLALDSRSGLLHGGHSGAAIVPGDPDQSLLVQAIRRTGDLAMPPEVPLDEQAIARIEHWIASGAAWPDTGLGKDVQPPGNAGTHWAFKPLEKVTVPQTAARSHAPVDAFIQARLEEEGLRQSPQAERRTLIRRVYYTLTGLPPTVEQVDNFVRDPAPDAYEALVDRVLSSPRFGEHWARQWLDVARYSDTKGYVYDREERFWVHAWAYRDWVAKSLNEDMPYDRFLLLQLAADQVEDRRPEDLAAMGYLTVGRRFLGVRRDIIDDQIDVVCRGMMGVTVSCARCHDHKYDPIPTADYYSLYGVFDSCLQEPARLSPPTENSEFEAELSKRQQELQTKTAEARQATAARVRTRIADYLFAQSELHKYPASGFDQIFSADDLLPEFVRRWQDYLEKCKQRQDPVFIAWHTFAELPADTFAESAADVCEQLSQLPPDQLLPPVARLFRDPPTSFREVCDRYGRLFSEVSCLANGGCTETENADRDESDDKCEGPTTGDLFQDPPRPDLTDGEFDLLKKVLFDADSPCSVPAGPIVHTEAYFDTNTCTELWKLQSKVDRWIIDANLPVQYALTLRDKAEPVEPRIFRRGNPLSPGRQVPRQFLKVLSGEEQTAFQQGSGRWEMAQAVIDPQNPLTPRVIANRIWAHYFGTGLVSTPSDFGTRAAPPSHPELLDWLASELIANDWSLKAIHRHILLSQTFRQSSLGPPDEKQLVTSLQKDPDNRLLWRMNARRLTFEEMRDSLLSVTGNLESTMGGKPRPLFEGPFPWRRSLYGLIDRQYLSQTLRTFDFASPDLHAPQRNETTVPQQALFFLNHPMVLDAARSLAEKHPGLETRAKIDALFRAALQRAPTEQEHHSAEQFILAASAEFKRLPPRPPATADWLYGYGRLDEATERVADFRQLPYFAGTAWQGGAKWPDPELGWVQLTDRGGHPGNDRSHAAIRRWKAPGSLTLSVESRLAHEPEAGDGIRAFIVSSRQGILHSSSIHHDVRDIGIASLEVLPGETIDFVVDIGDILNSDQFSWHITIRDSAGEREWDSARDFGAPENRRLEPAEQLSQILLSMNEFMFVD
jgi:hypothetical protein